MKEEKEYFGRIPNLTVIPWILWAVIIGFSIAAVLLSTRVFAEPMFKASANGVSITLYDEPCELKIQLPFKTTWEEDGKVFQGCWGPRPDAQVVVAYYEDLSIALIPFQAFKKVVGA